MKCTRVTDAGIVDFYPDFMSFWWCDLDCLDSEIFAGLPSDSSLSSSLSLLLKREMKGGNVTLHSIVYLFLVSILYE